MKITKIDFTPVAVPLHAAEICDSAVRASQWRTAVLVEIGTDAGITGIGESSGQLGCRRCIELLRQVKPLLLEKDPCNINWLMRQLYQELTGGRLPVQSVSWALAGVEMALWDILGKRAQKPLYEVWGGAYRTRIQFAGCVPHGKPEQMAFAAAELARQGCQVISVEAASSPEETLMEVSALRSGVPDQHIKLRVDARQRWTTGTAVSVIDRLEPYGLELVDNPVTMQGLDALKMVKDSVCVPVSAGGAGWATPEVLEALKQNAVDYLDLDGRSDAGYNGARLSAGIAEAAGVQCVLCATPGLGVALAMDLHLAASTANCTLACRDTGYDLLEGDVLQRGKLPKTGPWCDVPEEPGIGVSLDAERVVRYHDLYQELYGEADQQERSGNAQ